MFRKIAHIALSVFFMLATIGVTFSMHYCGGQYVSTSINSEADSCCDDDGCCENKTLHFQLEDNYVSPVELRNVEIVQLDILFPALFIFDFEWLDEEDKATEAFVDSSPPPKIQTRLALLQTFLC